ncbi:MAG TPA: DUF192 domain-containing protein [Candidatus Paceibacterota bacterium]|nr:DUF192 domain-containing protein [Candidatus Paceibacterota bacterium]
MYLKVEISDTPAKLEHGLMFRPKLGENDGMIFKFSYPKKLSFWGLNTYIPLDIAFINTNNKISRISHISPLSTKIVSSDIPCDIAIEANYNYFKKNKIKVGDSIFFKKITDKIGYISFF